MYFHDTDTLLTFLKSSPYTVVARACRSKGDRWIGSATLVNDYLISYLVNLFTDMQIERLMLLTRFGALFLPKCDLSCLSDPPTASS